jgi:hypothetical protein
MSDTGANDTIDRDVARYATAVRAAFADLPAPERELLLEDLEDHLQEVAAEAGGPLEERLGTPAAYAAELRASAGPPGAGVAAAAGRARPRRRASRVARRLRRSWRGTMANPAAAAVAEFLPELRPAWWVLRGYLAVLAASALLGSLYPDDAQGANFPVPELFGSQLLGLLVTVAAVVVSVRLGRRGPATGWRRGLAVAGNAALGLFAVFMLVDLGARVTSHDYPAQLVTVYQRDPSGLRAHGREISNIYAFDAGGKPLRDVYLIDQDGNPVVATHNDNPFLDPRELVDGDGNEVANRYPQAQQEIDPATGRRSAVPAPEFRPPPGPVRSP